MTPSLNYVPAPATPSLPPVAKKTYTSDNSSSTRPAKETKAKSSSSADDVKDKDDDDTKDVSSSDPTLFEQLIASLLTMQAPAQTPPASTTPLAASAVAATSASATASTPATPAASPQGQFGAAFNMDPAMLVLPQDVSAQALISSSSPDSFSAQLLAALTPGIPALPATAVLPQISAAPLPTDATIAVPVPVLDANATTTPALTAPASVPADPRLIATGLDPAQMQILKDKIAAATAAQQDSAATPAQKALPHMPQDSGVITVTLSSDTTTTLANTPPQPVPAPQVSNSAASVVVMTTTQLQQAASEAGLSMDMVADASADVTTPATQVALDGTTSAATDGSDFDPVEFRIAQMFQRPASAAPVSPQGQQQTPAPGSFSSDATAKVANSNVAVHVSSGMEGKANSSASTLGASLSPSQSMLSMDTASSFDSLITSPSAVPMTVTNPLTSPLVQNVTATQSSPAVQTVAAVIAKNAKEDGAQTINLRLDPPELGKLQVQMKYKKGDPLRVHVVLEKADTASMFQRDAHALEGALKDAGLQTDGSSLSFELAKDGNNTFNQAMGQNSGGSQNGSSALADQAVAETPAIESSMDVFTDAKTGITHYNLRV